MILTIRDIIPRQRREHVSGTGPDALFRFIDEGITLFFQEQTWAIVLPSNEHDFAPGDRLEFTIAKLPPAPQLEPTTTHKSEQT